MIQQMGINVFSCVYLVKIGPLILVLIWPDNAKSAAGSKLI